MIITSLRGGLGNQMFQYAAGRRLAIRNQTELKLDVSFLTGDVKGVTPRSYGLAMFQIQASIATPEEIAPYRSLLRRSTWKLLHNFRSSKYIQETRPGFIPEMLSVGDDRYIDGHWQTQRYFEDVESQIRSDFQFAADVVEGARPLKMQVVNSNSICVHVRRGDYVTNAAYNQIYGSTSMEYFNAARASIEPQVSNPAYFVFSDDIAWCEEQFRSWKNVTFVEKTLENTGAGTGDFLQLMASCKHHIISNSTFGWWGAWLGAFREKIVVAPANWYADKSIDASDICPVKWVRL